MVSAPSTAVRPARLIIAIAGLVLLLVVATVVVVLTLGSHAEGSFPAGSPQAVFQSYYRAFSNEDYEAAYGFFSQRVRQDVSRDDYVEAVRSYGGRGLTETTSRLRVDRVEERGDRATLVLALDYFYDSGLTTSQSSTERRIPMAREAGGWTIDQPLLGLDPVPLDMFQRSR